MKTIISNILYKLYIIRNKHIRTLLRKMISYFDGGQYYSKNLRKILKKYHNVEIGIGSYGSCFDPVKTSPNTIIGKYVSVASNVHFYTRNHAYWKVSSHPIFYNRLLGNLKTDSVKNTKLEVGNDVWIGQNVVILPSCNKIGNGAVIGAGSIITKDIPDYSIVVGNPGKVIRYRFNEEQIYKLNKIKWWNWDDSKIRKFSEKFEDINEFIKEFYQGE